MFLPYFVPTNIHYFIFKYKYDCGDHFCARPRGVVATKAQSPTSKENPPTCCLISYEAKGAVYHYNTLRSSVIICFSVARFISEQCSSLRISSNCLYVVFKPASTLSFALMASFSCSAILACLSFRAPSCTSTSARASWASLVSPRVFFIHSSATKICCVT